MLEKKLEQLNQQQPQNNRMNKLSGVREKRNHEVDFGKTKAS
jgi:hypothetical protein